ncbi:MAG: hypothetical protein D3916_12010 [Candidatus Electrothrix sp. MAN1_4]|nr:hypothetical protein [Candidatus Electrothrix sp. MAN1_4]
MADRISARRMLTNSFFLGVHTSILSLLAFFIKENQQQPAIIWLAPLSAAILLCFVWWRLVYSYRQLNSGKYKVIHKMEQMLPAAPYDDEWNELGCGKDSNLYKPLTSIENWIPVCFSILYLFLSAFLLAVYCNRPLTDFP